MKTKQSAKFKFINVFTEKAKFTITTLRMYIGSSLFIARQSANVTHNYTLYTLVWIIKLVINYPWLQIKAYTGCPNKMLTPFDQ